MKHLILKTTEVSTKMIMCQNILENLHEMYAQLCNCIMTYTKGLDVFQCMQYLPLLEQYFSYFPIYTTCQSITFHKYEFKTIFICMFDCFFTMHILIYHLYYVMSNQTPCKVMGKMEKQCNKNYLKWIESVFFYN